MTNVVSFPNRRTPASASDLPAEAERIAATLAATVRDIDALRLQIDKAVQHGDLDTLATDPLAYAALLDGHLADSRAHAHRATVGVSAAGTVLTGLGGNID